MPEPTGPTVARATVPLRSLGAATVACLAFEAGRPQPAPAEDAWRREATTIIAHRLAPLAHDVLHQARGTRTAGSPMADVMQAFDDDQFRRAVMTLNVKLASATALASLEDAGIRFVVIKGPAVARFHAAPRQRPYSDLDLVVHPDAFPAARRLLEEAGFTVSPNVVTPWEAFYRTCIEGINLHHEDGASIDLHHRVSPWLLSRKLGFDDLWSSSDEVRIGSVPCRVASAGHAAVIAVLHVVNDLWKGDDSLLSWRDVVVLLRHLGPAGFAGAFEDIGLAWLLPYVRESLCYIVDPVDPELLAGPEPTRRQDRRLRMLGWGRALPTHDRHPAAWALRLPWPRALLFLAGNVVPSPGYIRRWHGSYPRFWRRMILSALPDRWSWHRSFRPETVQS